MLSDDEKEARDDVELWKEETVEFDGVWSLGHDGLKRVWSSYCGSIDASVRKGRMRRPVRLASRV